MYQGIGEKRKQTEKKGVNDKGGQISTVKEVKGDFPVG